ncbi:MAG: hypothetical protein AAF384_13135 [Pseudomonadota bacterium]
MKRLMVFNSTLIAGAALSASSFAFAVPISDNYVGGKDWGYGDRIGSSTFEVSGAEVNRNGTVVSVDIMTNFAGRADEKLFSGYTNRPASRLNGVNMGIGYGDLFLNTSWDPFGSAPYLQDDNVTGTLWGFAFSIDADRWTDAGGTGTLYALNGPSNNSNALLSDDFMSGARYRNGQEIAVDRSANVTAIGSGTWTVTPGDRLSFQFDVAGTALANSSELAIHWAMGCGNDTIEGIASLPTDVPMPEPGTALLMLASLAGVRRFKS